MSPGSVAALAFDFNGTLSRDEPLLCEIYRELFAEHGRPLAAPRYYDELAGRSDEAIIGSWLGVGGAVLAGLVAERVERYRARATDGSTVAEAVREAVRYASGRVPLAIVSGAYRAEIELVLEAAGLRSHFAALVAADDVERGKPHPEGYLRALALLGVDAASTVALEDTEAGVASAKDAGLRCLAVAGTMPVERLAHADECVQAIDRELVQRLLGPA